MMERIWTPADTDVPPPPGWTPDAPDTPDTQTATATAPPPPPRVWTPETDPDMPPPPGYVENVPGVGEDEMFRPGNFVGSSSRGEPGTEWVTEPTMFKSQDEVTAARRKGLSQEQFDNLYGDMKTPQEKQELLSLWKVPSWGTLRDLEMGGQPAWDEYRGRTTKKQQKQKQQEFEQKLNSAMMEEANSNSTQTPDEYAAAVANRIGGKSNPQLVEALKPTLEAFRIVRSGDADTDTPPELRPLVLAAMAHSYKERDKQQGKGFLRGAAGLGVSGIVKTGQALKRLDPTLSKEDWEWQNQLIEVATDPKRFADPNQGFFARNVQQALGAIPTLGAAALAGGPLGVATFFGVPKGVEVEQQARARGATPFNAAVAGIEAGGLETALFSSLPGRILGTGGQKVVSQTVSEVLGRYVIDSLKTGAVLTASGLQGRLAVEGALSFKNQDYAKVWEDTVNGLPDSLMQAALLHAPKSIIEGVLAQAKNGKLSRGGAEAAGIEGNTSEAQRLAILTNAELFNQKQPKPEASPPDVVYWDTKGVRRKGTLLPDNENGGGFKYLVRDEDGTIHGTNDISTIFGEVDVIKSNQGVPSDAEPKPEASPPDGGSGQRSVLRPKGGGAEESGPGVQQGGLDIKGQEAPKKEAVVGESAAGPEAAGVGEHEAKLAAIPKVTNDEVVSDNWDRLHAGLTTELVARKMAVGMEGIEGREYGIREHSPGKFQIISRPEAPPPAVAEAPPPAVAEAPPASGLKLPGETPKGRSPLNQEKIDGLLRDATERVKGKKAKEHNNGWELVPDGNLYAMRDPKTGMVRAVGKLTRLRGIAAKLTPEKRQEASANRRAEAEAERLVSGGENITGADLSPEMEALFGIGDEKPPVVEEVPGRPPDVSPERWGAMQNSKAREVQEAAAAKVKAEEEASSARGQFVARVESATQDQLKGLAKEYGVVVGKITARKKVDKESLQARLRKKIIATYDAKQAGEPAPYGRLKPTRKPKAESVVEQYAADHGIDHETLKNVVDEVYDATAKRINDRVAARNEAIKKLGGNFGVDAIEKNADIEVALANKAKEIVGNHPDAFGGEAGGAGEGIDIQGGGVESRNYAAEVTELIGEPPQDRVTRKDDPRVLEQAKKTIQVRSAPEITPSYEEGQRAQAEIDAAPPEKQSDVAWGQLVDVVDKWADIDRRSKQTFSGVPISGQDLMFAGKLTAAAVRYGIVRFSEFVEKVRDLLKDRFDEVYPALHAAWNHAAERNPKLEAAKAEEDPSLPKYGDDFNWETGEFIKPEPPKPKAPEPAPKIKQRETTLADEDSAEPPGAEKPPAAAEAGGGRPLPDVASIKNRIVEEWRAAGARLELLAPKELGRQQTFEEWLDAAEKHLQRDPTWVDNLVGDLTRNPRAPSAEEAAGLTIRYHQLTSQYEDVYNRRKAAEAAGDPEAITAASDEVHRMSSLLGAFEEVSHNAGSESGRSLAARKMELKRDGSLANLTMRAQGMQRGKPLSESQHADVQKLYEQIKADAEKMATLQGIIDKHNEAESAKPLAESIAEIAKEANLPPDFDPQAHSLGKRILEWARSRRSAAMERIQARHTGTLYSGIDPRDLVDLTEIGVTYLLEGVSKFADWQKVMLDYAGKWIGPHLEGIWEQSLKSQEDVFRKANVSPEKKATVKKAIVEQVQKVKEGKTVASVTEGIQKRYAKNGLTVSGVRDLARRLLESGVHGTDPLSKAVHSILKGIVPDITRTESNDLINGRGRVRKPATDPVSVELTDISRQLALTENILGMQETPAKPPLGSGFGKQEPSQTERELRELYNEEKKLHPEMKMAKEGGLKTAMETRKTVLRNWLQMKNKEIATRQKIIKEKNKLDISKADPQDRQEVLDLEKERDRVKLIWDSVFGGKVEPDAMGRWEDEGGAMEDTWWKRLNAYKKHLTKRQAKLDERLADLLRTGKIPPKQQPLPLNLDRAAKKQLAASEETWSKVRANETKIRLAQENLIEKTASFAQSWIKACVFSTIGVVEHITGAVAWKSIQIALDETVRSALSRTIPGFRGLSPLEGRGDPVGYLRGFLKIGQIGRNAMDQLKQHGTQSHRLYGEEFPPASWTVPRDGASPARKKVLKNAGVALEMPGRTHGAMKEGVRTPAENLAWLKLEEYAKEQGQDVNDPDFQKKYGKMAHDWSLRQIAMQKSEGPSRYRSLYTARVNPKTGHKTVAGLIGETIGVGVSPVVRVGMNLTAELIERSIGGVQGWGQFAFHKIRGDLAKLPPEVQEAIARKMTYSVSTLPVWATLGLLVPTMFGGFYRGRGKEDKDKEQGLPGIGEMRIGGATIPAVWLKTPVVQVGQMFATLVKFAQDGKHDSTESLTATVASILDQNPAASGSHTASKLLNPDTAVNAAGELLRTMIIPGLLREAAKWGDPVQREEKGLMGPIQGALPGVRETLPPKRKQKVLK